MGNFEDRVEQSVEKVTGPLYGDNLLSELKKAMIKEQVFQSLFGVNGERIFVEEIPSYNDTVIPLIEFWWKSETYASRNTYLPGAVIGRIVLPLQIDRKNARPNFSRKVANMFQRFLGGDNHNLFDVVPGLIEFGYQMIFSYDHLLQLDGKNYPTITITVPTKFDLRLLQLQLPEIDWAGPLDTEEIGLIETYKITIADENSVVRIPEGVLVETDE